MTSSPRRVRNVRTPLVSLGLNRYEPLKYTIVLNHIGR